MTLALADDPLIHSVLRDCPLLAHVALAGRNDGQNQRLWHRQQFNVVRRPAFVPGVEHAAVMPAGRDDRLRLLAAAAKPHLESADLLDRLGDRDQPFVKQV